MIKLEERFNKYYDSLIEGKYSDETQEKKKQELLNRGYIQLNSLKPSNYFDKYDDQYFVDPNSGYLYSMYNLNDHLKIDAHAGNMYTGIKVKDRNFNVNGRTSCSQARIKAALSIDGLNNDDYYANRLTFQTWYDKQDKSFLEQNYPEIKSIYDFINHFQIQLYHKTDFEKTYTLLADYTSDVSKILNAPLRSSYKFLLNNGRSFNLGALKRTRGTSGSPNIEYFFIPGYKPKDTLEQYFKKNTGWSRQEIINYLKKYKVKVAFNNTHKKKNIPILQSDQKVNISDLTFDLTIDNNPIEILNLTQKSAAYIYSIVNNTIHCSQIYAKTNAEFKPENANTFFKFNYAKTQRSNPEKIVQYWIDKCLKLKNLTATDHGSTDINGSTYQMDIVLPEDTSIALGYKDGVFIEYNGWRDHFIDEKTIKRDNDRKNNFVTSTRNDLFIVIEAPTKPIGLKYGFQVKNEKSFDKTVQGNLVNYRYYYNSVKDINILDNIIQDILNSYFKGGDITVNSEDDTQEINSVLTNSDIQSNSFANPDNFSNIDDKYIAMYQALCYTPNQSGNKQSAFSESKTTHGFKGFHYPFSDITEKTTIPTLRVSLRRKNTKSVLRFAPFSNGASISDEYCKQLFNNGINSEEAFKKWVLTEYTNRFLI